MNTINDINLPIFCKIIEKLMIVIIKEKIQLIILIIIKKDIVIHSLPTVFWRQLMIVSRDKNFGNFGRFFAEISFFDAGGKEIQVEKSFKKNRGKIAKNRNIF